MAFLSILTLYNYRPDIFEGFRVPNPLNKQTVIDSLCLELAELSLVYPEPETMKEAIRIFTNIHYKEWADLQETLEYEYNPIWNVDGTETETRNLKGKKDKRGTDTFNESGSDVNRAGGSDTNVHSTAAYNETAFTDREKDQTTYGRTDTVEYGKRDETTYASGEDTSDTGTITRTRHGNIGVTKTQELIQAQRDVVQFNITEFIISQFKRKFCVMVY